jgi:hypothetical protein
LGSRLGEDVLSSWVTEHDSVKAQRTKSFVSARRLQEVMSQPGLGKDVGCRDDGDQSFCDIQRYVTNVQAYDERRAIKTGKKCKHLSILPAVTLQTPV